MFRSGHLQDVGLLLLVLSVNSTGLAASAAFNGRVVSLELVCQQGKHQSQPMALICKIRRMQIDELLSQYLRGYLLGERLHMLICCVCALSHTNLGFAIAATTVFTLLWKLNQNDEVCAQVINAFIIGNHLSFSPRYALLASSRV